MLQIQKFSKTVSYASLVRLDPTKSCRKVAKNLLFSAKMACLWRFLMKTANPSQLSDDFVQGLEVLEEHKRPFLKTSEFVTFSQEFFKALRAVIF